MSYKKVGGLHFVNVGRFGASFWASKPQASREETKGNTGLALACALTFTASYVALDVLNTLFHFA